MEQNRIPTADLPVVVVAVADAVPEPSWLPKAIVFDLLTALLDSCSLWDQSAGSAEKGRQWRTRYLELTFGCGPYRPYEQVIQQAAREVDLGPEASATLVGKWNHLQPWPEVKRVLEKLRSKRYKMGVVTNCSKDLGRRAASIVGLWDGIVTAEEAGFYKPHQSTYGCILTTLDVRPEDTLFVAGSSGDVIGAANAGMKVVWNNHVGLPAKLGSNPLAEGKSLDEVLAKFL